MHLKKPYLMKKFILTFLFILFLGLHSNSICAQAVDNTDEITVLKKANPNYEKENPKKENNMITSDKMENPNKKKDEEVDEKTMIITEKKSRNPKNPK